MKMRKEIHDHRIHMVKFFLRPLKRSLTNTGLSARRWQLVFPKFEIFVDVLRISPNPLYPLKKTVDERLNV